MELLSKMNQDVFNDFKNDEVKNLSEIRGGTDCSGRSGGSIVSGNEGDKWCAWDEGDAQTQEVCVYHNCMSI